MNAELEVIGQILMDGSKLIECDLKASHFVNSNYREIYQAILELSEAGEVIDPMTVSDYLQQKTGQDWLKICGQAANDAFCHKTFGNQIERVKKNGILHRAKSVLNHSLNMLEHTRDESAIDEAIQELMAIQSSQAKYSHTLNECIAKTLARLDEIHQIDGLVGIPTGLIELDDALGGFHDTDLIIIGARPAMGKTALLINMCYAGSVVGPVGFISAEQAGEQIGGRFISVAGSVDARKMRTAKFTDDEWPTLSAAVMLLRDRPVYIYDEGSPDIGTIIRVAREWKYRYGIKALYLDYIQLVKSLRSYRSKSEAVGEVAESLKTLAKQLEIPVIALSQVKRDVETRGDKRPGPADLSDSTEIERNADVIATIYRDEVYNTETEFPGVAEILLPKNRHGPTGVVHAKWIGKYMQFKDLNAHSKGYE
ncbi:MAG: AAA family ATPase [Pseudomonadales bacterium]|nr:AAA family ATPase [Pseudomonadales bacterium]